MTMEFTATDPRHGIKNQDDERGHHQHDHEYDERLKVEFLHCQPDYGQGFLN
jgi:hypothetical protein